MNSYPMDIRRVWGQNPENLEGFERIWNNLNRPDSKPWERLEINLKCAYVNFWKYFEENNPI